MRPRLVLEVAAFSILFFLTLFFLAGFYVVQEEIDVILEGLEKVSDRLNTEKYLLDVASNFNKTEALQVERIIERRLRGITLPLMSSNEVSKAVCKAFLQVILSTYYQADDVYYSVNEEGKVFRTYDRPSSPLETLERGGGDCEDLAILLNCLLKHYSRDKIKTCFIIASDLRGKERHVFLIVKYKDMYMILDPAQCYVSYNTELNLLIEVVKDEATYRIELCPHSLDWFVKVKLLKEGFAEIGFSRLRRNLPFKPFTFVNLEYLERELQEFLNYSMGPGSYVEEIICYKGSFTFSPTDFKLGKWKKVLESL